MSFCAVLLSFGDSVVMSRQSGKCLAYQCFFCSHFFLYSGLRDAVKTYLVRDEALSKKQAKAFEDGVPSSQVVLLKGANQYAFISNETEVLRAVADFVGGLH
jgi:hypothetical protein